MIDHHTIAGVSIAGSALDFFGGMYLAYDLLGGKHGPLRTLTRGLTYSLLCALGYAPLLGWRFALPVSVTTGFTIAIELARLARGQADPGLLWDSVFSAIRGVGFAVGLYPTFGVRFAVLFALLNNRRPGVRLQPRHPPLLDYESARRLRLTRKQFLAALNRAAGITIAALLSSWITHNHLHSWLEALRLGAIIGMITALLNFFGPYIEWLAEGLPERRLGVFGVALILAGFVLQSLQYWISLLDVPVR